MDLLAGVQKTLRHTLIARGVRSHTARLLGQSIHYYELEGEGRGPPIVLVHGLAGSANGFYKLFFGLSKRFSRLYAMDLPGHGFSPLPDGGPNPVGRQVELLTEFLRQKVTQPCLLVGTSLGGAMSITLAAQLPERILALLLIAPAGAQFPDGHLKDLEQAMAVSTVADARALTKRLFHKAPLGMLLFASQLRSMYSIPPVKAAFADARELSAVSPQVLSGLRMPVRVLWGGSEKILPNQSVEYFRAHLPAGSEVKVIPGFGHVPQMEKPQELLEEILAFADHCRL
ncbi:MAG: alpha/beta fold hydrolase [Myxococcota bacterium]|nr:alpha/beta fold hydrolase [Myxococcota bacterium]